MPLPSGINRLSHNISLQYFKSINDIKYSTTTDCTYYQDNGSTIPEMGYHFDYLDWDVIVPDSIGEAIYDDVYARAWGK